MTDAQGHEQRMSVNPLIPLPCHHQERSSPGPRPAVCKDARKDAGCGAR